MLFSLFLPSQGKVLGVERRQLPLRFSKDCKTLMRILDGSAAS